MNSIKGFFKRIKLNGLFIATAMIVLGIVLLCAPDKAIGAVCILLGIVLAVLAVIEIVGFFCAGSINNYSFAKAIGYAVIAIWLFTRPASIINEIINIVFAIAIIVSGAEEIQNSIKLCKNGQKSWWVLLILGLITVGLGIAIFFVKDSAMTYLGISLIVYGIIAITQLVVFDRRIRKVNERSDKNITDI